MLHKPRERSCPGGPQKPHSIAPQLQPPKSATADAVGQPCTPRHGPADPTRRRPGALVQHPAGEGVQHRRGRLLLLQLRLSQRRRDEEAQAVRTRHRVGTNVPKSLADLLPPSGVPERRDVLGYFLSSLLYVEGEEVCSPQALHQAHRSPVYDMSDGCCPDCCCGSQISIEGFFGEHPCVPMTHVEQPSKVVNEIASEVEMRIALCRKR